jgi:DNA-binding IclR family transcriptional regulator
MDRLCEKLGETIQLAQLDGIENVYIAISESRRPMRLASSVGMRLHAHATGIGKALLGMLEPDDARARLEAVTLPKLTEHTTTDVDELMEVVTASRDRGYALDDEEYISGCRCVAVPIFVTASGAPTAMSVTMPTSQTTSTWPESLVEPLQRAADEIRSLVKH